MGTGASSEPCVYERLWESIAVLRESGHRYGMSERDIEKFICQVLQTNEPRGRPQPAFPLLRATAKCALALCLLLVLGLGLSQPQSQSGAHSLGLNWSSPLGLVRLLDLPIAHKYNLQGYRGWWVHSPSPQNCSVCANGRTVASRSLRGAPLRPGTQLTIIKGGDPWRIQREHLEQLYESHSESVSLKLNQDQFSHYTADHCAPRGHDHNSGAPRGHDHCAGAPRGHDHCAGAPRGHDHCAGAPRGPANFTLQWNETKLRLRGSSGQKLLRWLFPHSQLPLMDGSGSALQRCVVSHLRLTQGMQIRDWLVLGSGHASVRVSPLPVCSHHCPSFTVQLSGGDMVLSDPRLWQMELFPGPDQTIFCDGSVF